MVRFASYRPCFASLLLMVALCAFAFSDAPQRYDGRVVGVTDGDTITVLVDKVEHKVRLHGIDTPERKQDFGTRARQFTSGLVFGKHVHIEVVDVDRYGRDVGLVKLDDGRILNHELVKAGFAWWYEEYAPGDKTLEHLQKEARKEKRGLWQGLRPQAPWEFRKEQSAKRNSNAAPRHNAPGDSPTAGFTVPPYAPAPGTVSSSDVFRNTPVATKGALVAITPTGDKYHNLACRYARNGKRVTIDAARAAGYTSCRICDGKATAIAE